MEWIERFVNNQFLFYSFLAILSVSAIILFTLVYMDRKNLKLFEAEEEDLIEDSSNKIEEEQEEIKITQIVTEDSEKPKANLEEVLEKMQADLDKKEDVVALFEQEQEEKAIISYQELLNSKNKNASGANKELLSVIEQIEAGNTGKELEQAEENDYKENFEFLDLEPKEKKKFQTTEFISPVYGKVENHIEYPKIPNFNQKDKKKNKNSLELDQKIDRIEQEESNHNDAFLNALKEFRSHLE